MTVQKFNLVSPLPADALGGAQASPAPQERPVKTTCARQRPAATPANKVTRSVIAQKVSNPVSKIARVVGCGEPARPVLQVKLAKAVVASHLAPAPAKKGKPDAAALAYRPARKTATDAGTGARQRPVRTVKFAGSIDAFVSTSAHSQPSAV